MGNGHPLARVIARPELISGFTERNMYFNTFGGNPVSAAVGTAVLDVLEDERLVENARDVGDYTLARLPQLAERHAIIGDVRGAGLFFAVELVSDRGSKTPRRRRPNGSSIACASAACSSAASACTTIFSRFGRRCRSPTQHADLLVDRLNEVLASL